MKKIIKNCAIIFALVSLTSCAENGGEVVGGTINSVEPFAGTSMEWLAQEELTTNVAAIFDVAVQKGLIKEEELNAPNTTILSPVQYAINRTVRRHNSVNHQKEWKKLYPDATEWTIDMLTDEELQQMKMYIYPNVTVTREALVEAGEQGIEIESLPFQKTVNNPNPAYNPNDKNNKEPQYIYTPEYAKYLEEQAVYDDLKTRYDAWAAYDEALEDWNNWNNVWDAAEKENYLLQHDGQAPTEPKKPTVKVKVKEGDKEVEVEVEVVRPTQTKEEIEELKPTKPEQQYETIVITVKQTVRVTLDPTNTNDNAAYAGGGNPGVGYQYSNFLMSTPEIIHFLFKFGDEWEDTHEARGKMNYEGDQCDRFYAPYMSNIITSTGVVHTIYVSDATYNERLHGHTLLFYGSRADDAKL